MCAFVTLNKKITYLLTYLCQYWSLGDFLKIQPTCIILLLLSQHKLFW